MDSSELIKITDPGQFSCWLCSSSGWTGYLDCRKKILIFMMPVFDLCFFPAWQFQGYDTSKSDVSFDRVEVFGCLLHEI